MSNRSIYAVEILVLLMIGGRRNPRPAHTIAESIGISISYIEEIFARLREAGLVRAEHGPGGGYYLNKTAEKITVADIVAPFEEPYNARLLRKIRPDRGREAQETTSTENLWKALENCTHGALARVSLSDLEPNRY